MLDTVKSLFGTEVLYEVLMISKKEAENPKKLRASYLKAARQFHPDKAGQEDKELHTKKFQILSKIVEVLQDEDLRKSYNETGKWPGEDNFKMSGANFKMANSEFLKKFEEFKTAYQGSDEEREDIKKLYEEGKGSIIFILDNLFCTEFLTDEERIKGIVEGLIKRKEVERIASKETEKQLKKRREKAKREEREAAELKKELGLEDSLGSLEEKILARREAAGQSFLNDLEKKYCSEEKEPKRKRVKRK